MRDCQVLQLQLTDTSTSKSNYTGVSIKEKFRHFPRNACQLNYSVFQIRRAVWCGLFKTFSSGRDWGICIRCVAKGTSRMQSSWKGYRVGVLEGDVWQRWIRSSWKTWESFDLHDMASVCSPLLVSFSAQDLPLYVITTEEPTSTKALHIKKDPEPGPYRAQHTKSTDFS